MTKYLIVALSLVFTACGYTSRDSEMIGQVKKFSHVTPIFCSNRVDVDVSLGVIRNGVGSMSNEDVWATASPETYELLKKANESGEIVKLTYDVRRVTFCEEDRVIIKAEITK